MAGPERRRVAIVTFGCKVNLFESEQIAAALSSSFHLVDADEPADCYVVNGCTVTGATDAQVRTMIRRLARREKPVFVTGCYARTQDPRLPTADNIHYFSDLDDLAHALAQHPINEDFLIWRARPVLKIADGCTGACTYCIIPTVRGHSIRSVSPEIIERQLRGITAAGYHEVVLTGIHVGKYGYERADGVRLDTIVEMAHDIVGRVRLSSIEPDEITDRLLDLAAAGKILPHWHVPLQSGSNRILRLMNRSYDTGLFIEKINKIVSAYSEPPAIGTDLIVGFPDEQDEDFAVTYELLSTLPLTYGHVFPFSPRRGTPAADLHRSLGVPAQITRERARRMRELFAIKRREFQRIQVGRTMDMILETELSPGRFEGTTDTYLNLTYHGTGAVKDLRRVIIKKEGARYYAEEVYSHDLRDNLPEKPLDLR